MYLELVTGDWLGEMLYWDTSELFLDREGEVLCEEDGYGEENPDRGPCLDCTGDWDGE